MVTNVCSWRDFFCALFISFFLFGAFSGILGDSLSTITTESIIDFTHKHDSSLSAGSFNQSTQPQPSDTAGIVSLDKMVVSANKRQELLEVSQSFSLIRPDEWTGTNKSLADVVAEQTGVQTRRYGGTGSFQTVSIRGVQGNNVLVLLDGIPLNSAMGGAVDLGAINPDRIGEIEIYKGIIPGKFGGNALGGVINLKSKTSMKAQSLGAQTSIGAYGYKKFGMEFSHSFSEKSRIFGSLNYVKSDNDWPYLARNKTPYNASDNQIRTVENHHYNFFEARIHPSIDLPGARTLASGVTYSTSQSGIPASESSTNKTAKHIQDLFVITSRLSQDNSSDKKVIVFTPEAGYLKWSDKTFSTSLDSSMGTPHGKVSFSPNSYCEMISDLHIAHFSCIADVNFTDHIKCQLTLQGKHSQIETTTHATNFPHGDWPGNAQELLFSGDLNGSLPAGTLKIGTNFGGVAKAVRSATDGGHNKLIEITISPSKTLEYPWSMHGGVQCRLENSFISFVNIARYSHLPGLREKYGTNGAIIPNPDLKEETGITIETGLRFIREHFFMETVLFRTETRDGIFMLTSDGITKPVNLSASLIRGIESSIWLKPFSFVQADFRITLQNAENRSRNLYRYYGKYLPNEPTFSGFGKTTLGPFKNADFKYWLDYKSFFYRDFGNTKGQRVPENLLVPGMVFHNAQISWKATKHLDFSASIRNFNGKSLRYEEIARSPESGYSWILYPANEWCFNMGLSF